MIRNNIFRKHLSFYAFLPLFLFLLFSQPSCTKKDTRMVVSPKEETGLKKVQGKRRLRILTDYNSTAYFIYRGTPMGFTYEVLKDYADHLGVKMDVEISTSLEQTWASLDNNEVDIVALDLPVNQENYHKYLYSVPILRQVPVLVQKKPKGWSALSWQSLERALVRDPRELSGKVVYVHQGSPFVKLLTMHSFEASEGFQIIENPDLKAEQLMDAVADGKIPYTVAYDHLAWVNQKFHPGLDVKTQLGSEQNLSWVFGNQSEDLQQDFNRWFEKYKKSRKFAGLYSKYFKNPRSLRILDSQKYTTSHGRISPYDALIRKYSQEIDWDWRLLASLIYYESKFHPEAQAWSGAMGLMQLMPETMEKFGIDSLSSPESQIAAGVKYIDQLDRQFIKLAPEKEERIKFVLAAYNVGIAHVLDARRLAEKYGKDKTKWTDNVDSFLLRKSLPKYYQDRLAYYGYCRGEEPFSFVNDVLNMYGLYKSTIRY